MSRESCHLSQVRLQCELVFLRKEHHHHVLVKTFLQLWRETSFWLLYILPQSAAVGCYSSHFGSFFDNQDLLLIKLRQFKCKQVLACLYLASDIFCNSLDRTNASTSVCLPHKYIIIWTFVFRWALRFRLRLKCCRNINCSIVAVVVGDLVCRWSVMSCSFGFVVVNRSIRYIFVGLLEEREWDGWSSTRIVPIK